MEGFYRSNLYCGNCSKPFAVFVPKGTKLLEDINLKVVYYKEEFDGEERVLNVKCSMCDLEKGVVKDGRPVNSVLQEDEKELIEKEIKEEEGKEECQEDQKEG